MVSDREAASERILLCAPFGRDAALIQSAISSAGLEAAACASVEAVIEEIANGAGAALVADEALSPPAIQHLTGVVKEQPSWSDFPFVVMTSGGASTPASRKRLKTLELLGNVTLLERPLRVATLNTTLKTALRARRRQYQIRDQLAATEAAAALVRESESQFRQMADGMPQLVWVTRPDGAHEYHNRRWYEYTGLDDKAARGDGWGQVLHPDDREGAQDSWRASLATGQLYEMECRWRRADGLYRWFLVRGIAVRDAQGQIARWFGTCTDIHDQKMVVESLRQANSELEEFAYIASHDLQEPLRMVNSFTQLLLQRHIDSSNPEPAEFAEYIRSGVRRMHLLIEDLLAYSRAIHGEHNVQGEADLCAVLKESLEDLQPVIESAGARIHCHGLPTVTGDAAQLQHVLQNLLSNALKYRREDVPPEIEVSAEEKDTEWVISIRDNGIGFDEQYTEKIFGLFKRLHRDEYPGTGLGLAICKRIVERHGGRIWAESSLGKGSVFYFSLPGMKHGQTASNSAR